MPLFTPTELAFVALVRDISYANPFLARRVDLEREALGASYVETGKVKAFEPGQADNPNMPALEARASQLLEAKRAALRSSRKRPTASDREAAGDLGLFVLYHRHLDGLGLLARGAQEPSKTGRLRVAWFPKFAAETEQLLTFAGERLRPSDTPERLIALFFQMARAFVNIYAKFVGRTPAAEALRAAMWESIFTHDLARYRRSLMPMVSPPGAVDPAVMADIPTLITGPSGTGKELVAQAIGRSGFVPLDPARNEFVLDPAGHFLPIHLAALSPGVIESELFGHRRGAFTGALEDRASFLETCAPFGAVFLDEIAEVDVTLQIKLLRVLQTRRFQRLGDGVERRFRGRLISATNRDLAAEIEAGRFREDLYFRLNADRLETPRLADLIEGRAAELEHLVHFVAERLLPARQADKTERSAKAPARTSNKRSGATSSRRPPSEAAAFATELCEWIEAELGLDYAWPGNFRELEQCARAYLIRGRYRPETRPEAQAESNPLVARVTAGSLTADQLLDAYCAQIYAEVGSFEGAARRLQLDRRTVRSRVARALVSPCLPNQVQV